jgi:hypothetical protein
VRFLDRPKGDHHGETYRDEAIRAARSPVVCYLCDDDVLLPDHVESMIELLADADLAQSLNGYVAPDGRFVPYASDLAEPAFRRWLLHPQRNSVSVTGTAHTVAAYLRLPEGWEVPPPGRLTDHFMWQKFLGLPGLRAATSDRVTAVQFPTHLGERGDWTPARRRDELVRFLAQAREPEGRRAFDDVVRDGLNRMAARFQVTSDERSDALVAERARCDDLGRRCEDLEATLVRLRGESEELVRQAELARHERDGLAARLALIEGSRTWRLRDRVVRGPLGRWVSDRPTEGATGGSPPFSGGPV